MQPSAIKITEDNIQLVAFDVGVDVKELEHLKGYYAIWELGKPWRYLIDELFHEQYFFFTSENPRGFRIIMQKDMFNV